MMAAIASALAYADAAVTITAKNGHAYPGKPPTKRRVITA